MKQNFIVNNELQAYQEWLSLHERAVKLLINSGIRVKANKGIITEIISKENLTLKEKTRIIKIAEKYLYLLDKIAALKARSKMK